MNRSAARFNKTKIKLKAASAVAGLMACIASGSSFASTVSIEITNLTHGSYFTPLLVSAHADQMHLFELGVIASDELQAMAEGGSIDGLVGVLDAANAVSVSNPAEGLLAPAGVTMINDMDTLSNTHLSITAMVLPSNDGFVGLDAWEIPEVAGTYTLYLNAYDAGTEANDEVVNGGGASGVLGIPANPGENGGVNAEGVTTTESNSNVHIHRGILGDSDPEGGRSDLDSSVHRWLNPVAKVVVIVQ